MANLRIEQPPPVARMSETIDTSARRHFISTVPAATQFAHTQPFVLLCQAADLISCPPPVSKPSAPCRGSCSLARDLKVPSRPHGAARNRRAPVRTAPQPVLVPTSER